MVTCFFVDLVSAIVAEVVFANVAAKFFVTSQTWLAP